MIAQLSPRQHAAREQWQPGSTSRARLLAGQILAAERRRVRQLVEDNLGLLPGLAHQIGQQFPDLDRADLAQAAYPGLVRAAETYDPTRGAAFSTWFFWKGRDAIQRELPALLADAGIRVPRRAPRPSVSSLDAPDDNGHERASRLASDGSTCPAEAAQLAENRDHVRDALGRLRFPRDARVVALRFGLDGEPPMTLREIGEVLGVGVERVQQLETRALAELRDLLG